MDALYGPYPDLAAACAAVPNAEKLVDGVLINFRQGQVVGIKIAGVIVDHNWKTGFNDNDLIRKEFVDQITDDEFIYTLTDKNGAVLISIDYNGKAILHLADNIISRESLNDDVKTTLSKVVLNEQSITDLQLYSNKLTVDEEFIYTVLDSTNALLFGIQKDGKVKLLLDDNSVNFNQLSGDIKSRLLSVGYFALSDEEEYLYTILDTNGSILFSIDKNGKTTLALNDRAITENLFSDNLKTKIAPLQYLGSSDDNDYIFTILDNDNNVLFGILKDGSVAFKNMTPEQLKADVIALQSKTTLLDEQIRIGLPIEQKNIGDSSKIVEGEILIDQWDNPLFTQRSWQGIPTIQIAKDGVLYAAWYSGQEGERLGNYVTVAISEDSGITWYQNAIVINPTVNNVRFFDPVLWEDKFGNLFLSFAKGKGSVFSADGTWYCKITKTNTLKVSQPIRLAEGVMMNKPLPSVSQSKLYYPIALWNLSKTAGIEGIDIYASSFSNLTKKSRAFGKTSTLNLPNTLRTFDEHQILQLTDLNYMGMIRGEDGLYMTHSSNLGAWDVPIKFTALGPAASSRFFLGRLISGKIALVFNNSYDRDNLKIFLSDDEGQTWGYSLMIDNRLGVSYPDLSQDASGKIYLTYDYNRYSDGKIYCVKFTENDIITNSPGNIERLTIHSLL